jgi:hypothetical protein
MDALTRILLSALYPLLMLAWLVNKLLGRNRLRLLNPPGNASYWIERRNQPDTTSYFSEVSCCEGGDEASVVRHFTLLLRSIARLYARSRQDTYAGTIYTASDDREQPIPDEIYTLW